MSLDTQTLRHVTQLACIIAFKQSGACSGLPHCRHRENAMALVITVLDLEREPVEFSETVPPGAIDYGSGIRQIDGMPVNGRADLITEHRGLTS